VELVPGKPFTIVGIGASAGGLDAFTQLLITLPVDTGMAFILVQHLDPTHESQLSEILARATTMPVREATEALPIEPNSVYVIPPNRNITLSGGAVHLTPRVPHTINLPIDCLFESLAAEQGPNAVGVVLSGTGNDGTEGLKAIKRRGGLTFVQTESTAKFEGMPHSAIASGAADFTLSPAEIAQELARVSRHPYIFDPDEETTPDSVADRDGDLDKIFEIVHSVTGVDFSHYKRTTALRRIGRRMVVRNASNIGEYLNYVQTHPDEIRNLYQDLLISVTQFFRDPDAFVSLAKYLGEVLKKAGQKSLFRVWVPGCATGEEVYSLAISLDELFRREGIHPALQIFGTDISDLALSSARAGRYLENISREVSAERLHRYFHRIYGHYQINQSIRDLCVFAKQDLTYDAPFSRMDLISCRNTLIYLDGALQKKVLSTLHYSLLEGGVLFLGPSESPGESSQLLSTVDAKYKIYVRRPRTASALSPEPVRRADSIYPPTRSVPLAVTSQDWLKQADQLIQDRYAPDGVIINQEMTIVQVRGRTRYYLQSPAIGATQNLLLLAHEDLQQPLREAALTAIAQNIAVQRNGLHLNYHGEIRDINLEVIPLSPESAKERFYFVLLEHLNAPPVKSGPEAAVVRAIETPEQTVFRLKRENADLSDLLHSLGRDHKAVLEQQMAFNEEISSGNEELQSTNEELATAKEELQSANEELNTLNQELQNRNRELTAIAGDLTNLLSAVDTPILMFDRSLLLRRITPAAEQRFGLSAADLGRSLIEIPLWIHVSDLQKMVRSVIDTAAVATREIADDQGRWWSLAIWPYLAPDRRVEGAVLTFGDIDSLKHSLGEAETARAYAEGIVDTLREPLLILDGDLRVKTASRTFYQTFSASREQTEGAFLFDLGDGEWNIPALRKELEAILPQNQSFQDFEVAHEFAALGHRVLLLNARQLYTAGDRVQLVLLAIEDVTERRKMHDDLQASNEDLQRFAYAAAHDLRAPLNSSYRVSQILAEGLAGKLDEHESAMLTLFIESMDRLRKLMEDILTYSGMGNSPQQLTSQALVEPLEVALANLQQDIQSTGAVIEVGALPTLPLDSSRIAMVFQNLIDNALKYRGANVPRIEIAAVRLGGYWQISVKDNGQGFDSKYAARAFEPFKRLSQSDVPGSGIGLATCKRIIERLGGRIWVQSALDEGSSFYFTLPSEATRSAGAQ
jgi:two-component system CheB/CheR fusion protein